MGKSPRGPVEDESGEEVAVDNDDVEDGIGYADGGVEGVCGGFDEGDSEAEEPEVGALLRVAASQHQQDADEQGQRRQIGEKGVVHRDRAEEDLCV